MDEVTDHPSPGFAPVAAVSVAQPVILRDRTDRKPVRLSDITDKAKSIIKSIPAWFYLAPVISFFVSAASFGTAGV